MRRLLGAWWSDDPAAPRAKLERGPSSAGDGRRRRGRCAPGGSCARPASSGREFSRGRDGLASPGDPFCPARPCACARSRSPWAPPPRGPARVKAGLGHVGGERAICKGVGGPRKARRPQVASPVRAGQQRSGAEGETRGALPGPLQQGSEVSPAAPLTTDAAPYTRPPGLQAEPHPPPPGSSPSQPRARPGVTAPPPPAAAPSLQPASARCFPRGHLRPSKLPPRPDWSQTSESLGGTGQSGE